MLRHENSTSRQLTCLMFPCSHAAASYELTCCSFFLKSWFCWFQHNNSVHTLNMANNRLGSAGTAFITEALQENRSLADLVSGYYFIQGRVTCVSCTMVCRTLSLRYRLKIKWHHEWLGCFWVNLYGEGWWDICLCVCLWMFVREYVFMLEKYFFRCRVILMILLQH